MKKLNQFAQICLELLDKFKKEKLEIWTILRGLRKLCNFQKVFKNKHLNYLFSLSSEKINLRLYHMRTKIALLLTKHNFFKNCFFYHLPQAKGISLIKTSISFKNIILTFASTLRGVFLFCFIFKMFVQLLFLSVLVYVITMVLKMCKVSAEN